jgi:hypothetical protein
MFHLQYYLLATVIHRQSLRSQIYIFIHMFFTVQKCWSGAAVTAACHFGHAYSRFVRSALYSTGRRDLNPRPLYTSPFLWRNSPPWAWAASLRFLDHTRLDTHTHTHGRASLNEWLARHKGHCLHNKDKWRTHHTLSEIWTRDPSHRAAVDPRLRLHGHWDRRLRITL